MLKVQLRLPKSKAGQEPVRPQAQSNSKVAAKTPIVVVTAKGVAPRTKTATAQAVAVATKKSAVTGEVTTAKQTPERNGVAKTEKPRSAPVAAIIIEHKAPRETRLRGRVEVRKFLPRVERVATLRTVRAIDFLTQIEGRAVESRRLSKDTKFPMSILEMKALNEAIKIMQVKHKLELADIERQKAEKTGTVAVKKTPIVGAKKA